jgi:hypothetical protein
VTNEPPNYNTMTTIRRPDAANAPDYVLCRRHLRERLEHGTLALKDGSRPRQTCDDCATEAHG